MAKKNSQEKEDNNKSPDVDKTKSGQEEKEDHKKTEEKHQEQKEDVKTHKKEHTESSNQKEESSSSTKQNYMKTAILVLVAVLVVAIGLVSMIFVNQGVDEGQEEVPVEIGPDETDFEEHEPSENPDEAAVTVNGHEITNQEIDNIILASQQSGMPVEKDMVIEQLVEQQLLYEEAQNQGIEISTNEAEDELRNEIQMISEQTGMTEDEILEEQMPENMDFDDMVKEWKITMSINELSENLMEDVETEEISEEEAREIFEQIPQEELEMMYGEAVNFDEISEEFIAELEQQQLGQQNNQILQELVEEKRDEAEIEYH